MNKRKEYIEKNRNLFDDKVPSTGHFERFEALLNEQADTKEETRDNKKTLVFKLISIAASIAILIGVGINIYTSSNISPITQQVEGDELMNEFQATNDYYSQRMEEYIADIMCKLANTDAKNQAQLTKDIENIINNNTSFVTEMKNNENKEIALRYLVKHYKTNIQALENINNKLGKVANC